MGHKMVFAQKSEGLPQLCTEHGMQFDRDGVVVVSSRDVGARFDKRHDNVLRDIEQILISSELRTLKWFRPTSYVDERGRSQSSYLLTRDGFMLLVMGWTGETAFSIKIQYIQAFNLMEQKLLGHWREGMNWAEAIDKLREDISTIKVSVLHVADDTTEIKQTVRNRRREISPTTKTEHIFALGKLGGRCPCCGLVEIVKDGERIQGEFDHFFQNSVPGVSATWLICLLCHGKLTSGRMMRDHATTAFHVYQDRRRALPGRQPSLF